MISRQRKPLLCPEQHGQTTGEHHVAVQIAVFAFGLAAVIVAGFQHADAAPRRNVVHGYSATIDAGEALFEHAKGGMGY